MLTSVFRFLSVGTLKNSSGFSSIENEGTIRRIFNVCQAIHNRPGNFETTGRSMLDLIGGQCEHLF